MGMIQIKLINHIVHREQALKSISVTQ